MSLKKKSMTLAAIAAVVSTTVVTPEMIAQAQTNAEAKNTKEASQDDAKVVLPNTNSIPVEDTAEYDRKAMEALREKQRKEREEAEKNGTAPSSGITVSTELLRDGTGHGSADQTWVSDKNNISPGDNTEKDGIVTPGDAVTYQVTMNFTAGPKRQVDIFWSNVSTDGKGVENNMCQVSEGGIRSVASGDNACRFFIEEGATGQITRQLSYQAPVSKEGKTDYMWSPKIGTSLGEELDVKPVRVVSMPRFVNGLGSSSTYTARFDGVARNFVVSSENYTKGLQGNTKKGFYSGEVKPYRVEVDVSKFPKGTQFPGHEVKNGTITLTMTKTDERKTIDYILPLVVGDEKRDETWEVTSKVIDELVTLDGVKNNGDGKNFKSSRADGLSVDDKITISASAYREQGSTGSARGSEIRKDIYAPSVKSGFGPFDASSKKIGKELDSRNIAPGTQIVSNLSIIPKNTLNSNIVSVIDIWNPKESHFDSSRKVTLEESGDLGIKKHTIYYTTKDFFQGKNNPQEPPSAIDSSWTTTKPKDEEITGIKVDIERDSSVDWSNAREDSFVGISVPQVALRAQDYGFTDTSEGDTKPIRDFYQLAYLDSDNKVTYYTETKDRQTDVMSMVHPKPYIDRSTSTKDNTKAIGDRVENSIQPYIYDVVSKEQSLTPTVKEYLDRCFEEIEVSRETKKNYNYKVVGNPGKGCYDGSGERPYIEFTPKNLGGLSKNPDSISGSVKTKGLLEAHREAPAYRLPKITYSSRLSEATPRDNNQGYDYNMEAEISLPEGHGKQKSDRVAGSMHILHKSDILASKTPGKSRVGVDDQLTWNISLSNYSSTVANVSFIDVLPFNGSEAKTEDGTVTNFQGTLDFASAEFTGRMPKGAKLYYTSHDPKNIDPNVADQSGVKWVDSVDALGGASKVTAIKVEVPQFGKAGSRFINVALNMIAKGNKNGDTYVNKMSQSKTENPIDIPAPGASSITSLASTITGRISWDHNRSHNFDGDDEGIGGIKVYARRVGDDTILETTTSKDGEVGSYKFEDLKSGQYEVWIDQGEKSGQVPSKGETRYKRSVDVEQTYSYGGNIDASASLKASMTVPGASNVTDVDFGFVTPNPKLQVNKDIISQVDNKDGTFDIEYRVHVQNSGSGDVTGVNISDRAESNQKIKDEEITRQKIAKRYRQIEYFGSMSLAIDENGDVYVRSDASGVSITPQGFHKVNLPDGVKGVKVGKNAPAIELSDGTVYIPYGFDHLLSNGFGIDGDLLEHRSASTNDAENLGNIYKKKDGSPFKIAEIKATKKDLGDGTTNIYTDDVVNSAGKFGPGIASQRPHLNDLYNEKTHLIEKSRDFDFFFWDDSKGNLESTNYKITYKGKPVNSKDILYAPLVPSYYFATTSLFQDGSIKWVVPNHHKGEINFEDGELPGGDVVKEIYTYRQSSYGYTEDNDVARNKDGYGINDIIVGNKGIYLVTNLLGNLDSKTTTPLPQVKKIDGAKPVGIHHVFFSPDGKPSVAWIGQDGGLYRARIDNMMMSDTSVPLETVFPAGTFDPKNSYFSASGKAVLTLENGTLYSTGTFGKAKENKKVVAQNVERRVGFNRYLTYDQRTFMVVDDPFGEMKNRSEQLVDPSMDLRHIGQYMNSKLFNSLSLIPLISALTYYPDVESSVGEVLYKDMFSIFFVESLAERLYQAIIRTSGLNEGHHGSFTEGQLGELGRIFNEELGESPEIFAYFDDIVSFYRLENRSNQVTESFSGGKDTTIPEDPNGILKKFQKAYQSDAKRMKGLPQEEFENDPYPNVKKFYQDKDNLDAIRDVYRRIMVPFGSQETPKPERISLSSTSEKKGLTTRLYDVGDLRAGESATLTLHATVSQEEKEQFLANQAWVRANETTEGLRDPKGVDYPKSTEDFKKLEGGIDASSGEKSNQLVSDDEDLYDGVPVYVTGLKGDQEVAIGGIAWEDLDGDGVRSEKETMRVGGVRVTVKTTGKDPKVVGETTTSKNGSWSVMVPRGQNYTVEFDSGSALSEKILSPVEGKDSRGMSFTTDVIATADKSYDIGFTTSERSFDVSKRRIGEVPKVTPGKSFTDTFEIKVSNTLKDDMTLGKLLDHPSLADGMKVSKMTFEETTPGIKDAKVQEATPDKDGAYLIGDSKSMVKSGQSMTFKVSMTVDVAEDFAADGVVLQGKDSAYKNVASSVDHDKKDKEKGNNGGSFDLIPPADKTPSDDGDDAPGGDGDGEFPETPMPDTPGNDGDGDTPGGDMTPTPESPRPSDDGDIVSPDPSKTPGSDKDRPGATKKPNTQGDTKPSGDKGDTSTKPSASNGGSKKPHGDGNRGDKRGSDDGVRAVGSAPRIQDDGSAVYSSMDASPDNGVRDTSAGEGSLPQSSNMIGSNLNQANLQDSRGAAVHTGGQVEQTVMQKIYRFLFQR